MRRLLFFLLFSIAAFAQKPTTTFYVFDFLPPTIPPTGGGGACPGGTGGSPGFCTEVSTVLPYVDGVTLQPVWSKGNSASGTGQEIGIESQTVPGSYDFSEWDVILGTAVAAYSKLTCGALLHPPGHLCLLGIAPAHQKFVGASGINTFVPPYIFSTATISGGACNGLTWADCAAPSWAASTPYPAGYTVKFGGLFYQNTTAAGNCTSGLSGPTGSDGSCTWGAGAAHGAPQDSTFGTNYAGAPNWIAATGYAYGFLIQPSANTHFYQQVTVGGCNASGGAAPTFPTNGTSVTEGSGVPACQWQDESTSLAINANTVLTSGTTVPFTSIANGFSPTFETPYNTAYNNFNTALIQHMMTQSYASLIRFIRMGIGPGSENTAFNITGASSMASLTSNFFNTWIQTSITAIKLNNSTMQAQPTKTTLITVTNGCNLTQAMPCTYSNALAVNGTSVTPVQGFGNEGLVSADLFKYGSAPTSTTGPGCSDNWCILLKQNPQIPLLELETSTQSDPSCIISAANSAALVGCLNMMLPFVTQRAMGYPGSIYWEAFTCDLNNTFNSGTAPVACNYNQYGNGQTWTSGTANNPYWNAIFNWSQGIPTGTESVLGKAAVLGTAKLP